MIYCTVFPSRTEEALRAGDIVGGGGAGARDGFGAHGIPGGIVAGIVIPSSIVIIHVHAVGALAPARLIYVPVCVRATIIH